MDLIHTFVIKFTVVLLYNRKLDFDPRLESADLFFEFNNF